MAATRLKKERRGSEKAEMRLKKDGHVEVKNKWCSSFYHGIGNKHREFVLS